MTARITLAAIGDSQTDTDAAYGVPGYLCWPALLATGLKAEGIPARARNFGVSGDTTTQMLARFSSMFRYDTPDIGIIYGGVNDPGASITSGTTQSNLQAMCAALKHGAKGNGIASGSTVAGQATLPGDGEIGQRYVVLSDTSTTGGAVAWHPSHATTITGTNAGVTVWEHRYPLAGEMGWGRVAISTTAPTAVKKIIVISTNYLNWTTGGDTLSTPYATYAPLRTAAQAAVTAENVTVGGVASVVYADLYNLQKSRIQAGTDPNFASVSYDQTKSWHIFVNNQHHSAYGHLLVAQAARGVIPSAWLA